MKYKRSINSERVINYLRGLLIATFFFLAVNVFSQVEVKAITTGYYTCWQDGVVIDNHTLLQKATTHCSELKLNNPDSEIWFTYPTQTRVDASGIRTVEVDTITVTRVKDVKGWIDNTQPKRTAYLPFYNNGIIDFEIDTIYNWQSKYNFKRTKTFGKVAYENLDIPFQFMDVWGDIEKQAVWFRITEKQVRITSWVDGELYKEFLPGSSNPIDNGFEFYFYVPKVGELKVEVENEAGDVITYETTLKL